MSQKEIKLFDNSVIKLTIKQGLESERFPITIEEAGKFTYINTDDTTKDGNVTRYDDIITLSGSLSSGELGYTRDTNRLFVGNISDTTIGDSQQTLGGVLSGNKYLGFIDSRRKSTNNGSTSENNAEALPLSGAGGLLNKDSDYRSYNFSGSSDVEGPFKTEDNKWPKLSYYNETYDAYDGDYVYDIYRNALILFDHNIKPEKGFSSENLSNGLASESLGNKVKTPLLPLFYEKNLASSKGASNVYNFTKDMYGDGYVLLYNIVPDGDTLTFRKKGFDQNNKYSTVNSSLEPENYSYNILTLNNVPINLIKDEKHFDSTYFDVSNTDGPISLKSKITDIIDNVCSIDTSYTPNNYESTYVLLAEEDTNGNNTYFKSTINGKNLKDLEHFIGGNSTIEAEINNLIENKGYTTESKVKELIANKPVDNLPTTSSSSSGGCIPNWAIADGEEILHEFFTSEEFEVVESSPGIPKIYYIIIENDILVKEYEEEELPKDNDGNIIEPDGAIRVTKKTITYCKDYDIYNGPNRKKTTPIKLIDYKGNNLTIYNKTIITKTITEYTSTGDEPKTYKHIGEEIQTKYPISNYFIFLTPSAIDEDIKITTSNITEECTPADNTSNSEDIQSTISRSEPIANKTWKLPIKSEILLPFGKDYQVEITNVGTYQIIEAPLI